MEPQVADLLEDIRAIRLTLTADLAAAAGALDEQRPAVARDILAADSAEIQRRLAAYRELPQQRSVASSSRRRVLLALPAIPLVGALAMTAAAALGSYEVGHARHHVKHTAVTRPAQPDSKAHASTVSNLSPPVPGAASDSQGQRSAPSSAAARTTPAAVTPVVTTPTAVPTENATLRHLIAVEHQVLTPISGKLASSKPSPTPQPTRKHHRPPVGWNLIKDPL